MKGDKQDVHFDKHRTGILAFSTAHDHVTRHLNGRTKIPLNEWKNELVELTVQCDILLAESDELSAKLRSAKVIKRNAEKVMNANIPNQKREQDISF